MADWNALSLTCSNRHYFAPGTSKSEGLLGRVFWQHYLYSWSTVIPAYFAQCAPNGLRTPRPPRRALVARSTARMSGLCRSTLFLRGSPFERVRDASSYSRSNTASIPSTSFSSFRSTNRSHRTSIASLSLMALRSMISRTFWSRSLASEYRLSARYVCACSRIESTVSA